MHGRVYASHVFASMAGNEFNATDGNFFVNKRLLWNGFKYLLAVGLLTYVIWRNWSPTSPSGDALPGLRDVWETHVVQGQPIHTDFLAAAAIVGLAAVLLTIVRWYYLVRAQG